MKQAFPTLEQGGNGLELTDTGMTLRDYFAAKAMQGMIASPFNEDAEHVAAVLSNDLSFSGGWRGRIAVAAYAMADAMMKARGES